MFKKYLLVFILACIPFMSFAGTVIIEDYPTMYFPDKNGVKLDVVEDIILDAVDRSSYPRHLWTVDSTSPGKVIARLNVRSHVLRMKITYDKHKINYQYHDSVRLKYSVNSSGMQRIHEKYNVWSEFLLSKIKYVAKRKTKMDFVSESPLQQVVVSQSGEVIKPMKLLFSVYGDTNNRGRESGIYDDQAMSNAMAREMVKYLKKVKPANVRINKIKWNKQLYTYMVKHNRSIPAKLCDEYQADAILTGYLDDSLGGTTGSRDMYYQLFTCRTEDLVKEKYDTIDSYDEKFAYHFDLIKHLKSFARQYKPFQR